VGAVSCKSLPLFFGVYGSVLCSYDHV